MKKNKSIEKVTLQKRTANCFHVLESIISVLLEQPPLQVGKRGWGLFPRFIFGSAF